MVADTYIDVSLHRPAQANELQGVMSQGLRYDAGRDNEDWSQHNNEDELQAWKPPYDEVCSGLHFKACHEQRVALSGSWCQVLPDASMGLSQAHARLNAGYDHCSPGIHFTLGDDMIVTVTM